MSARAPSASICRSTSPCPIPSSPSTVVVTKGLKEREQVRARLEKALATRFPQVVARVYPLELGPPVGWPVKYRVSGPDLARVRSIALQVADLLGTTAGVRNVNFDWVEPARVMRIHIDQDQARQLGLSSAAVATALNAVVTGTTVTQVRDSIYLIDVVAARRTVTAARRLNRFARCRSRCPAVTWFRSGRSPASITPRNTPSSGGAIASPP